MRALRHLRVLALPIAASLAAACSSPRPPVSGSNYVERVAAGRAAKDDDFRKAADGQPIPKDRRDQFLPLAYFPIDPDYKAAAVFTASGDQTAFSMPTSTGTMRQMRRAGTLAFTLKGQPLTLTAFNEVGEDPSHLFVPFSDLTSGAETYPAGRYLDLDRNATGLYEVDFNLAYHPYCYYNLTYECPLPPLENRLKRPIHAGERLKQPNK